MRKGKLPLAALATALMIFLGSNAFAQDLMDVIVSLKNIDKKITELEAAQKRDVQKLQNQIAQTGGVNQTFEVASIDTLRDQVTDLRKTVGDYSGLNGSLMELASKFESLEKELSLVKTSERPSGGSLADGELLAELKNLTGELKEVIKDRPAEPVKPAVTADKGAASKLDFKFYGFIKLEAIHDNTEIVKGDWMLYANRGNTAQAKQKVFTMNARHSRLGLQIGGPAVGTNGKIQALVEVDFAGGFPNSSTAARQPILNLRHAWLEINYPKWQARFGQDWALISGPFPNTSSFVVNGGSGNLWMRFPQISFTYKNGLIKWSTSINRPIAGNVKYEEYAAGDLDPVDDGERSGYPWLMSRFWFIKGGQTASVSGHYGQELINDLSSIAHRVNTYSINGDVVSKTGHFGFTSRAFYGENLNSFLGGVLQGYTTDSTSVQNIRSVGGWGQAQYEFTKSWSSTIGFGIDDPVNSDLKTGMRSQNRVIFANIVFKIQKALELMIETEHLKTSYLNSDTGKNLRFQFASYFKF